MFPQGAELFSPLLLIFSARSGFYISCNEKVSVVSYGFSIEKLFLLNSVRLREANLENNIPVA